MASCSDFGLRPQLLSTECNRRNLLLTNSVRYVHNICGMTPKSSWRWASFLTQWRYSVFIDKRNASMRFV